MIALAWIRANKVVVLLIVAALIALALGFYTSWQARQTAKTETSLSKNQAGAALESGRDAANTVGNRAEQEVEADRVTRENADEIRAANGSGDAVNPDVSAAGRRALCRRTAYRDTLGCKAKP